MIGGGRGHGRGTLVRENAAQTQGEASLSTELSIDPENPGLLGLNNEQWQTLTTMLSKQKSDTNERLMGKRNTTLIWIIDSAATNHIIGDLK